MKKVLGLLLVLVLGFVDATSYYVSNSGNDSNSGTSDATAWKTIGKVNSFNFSVGDDVYFKCGGVWKKQTLYIDWSGNSSNPVIVGAYYMDNGKEQIGVSGMKPIFDGEETYPSSIYGYLVGISPGHSYVNITNLKVYRSGGGAFSIGGKGEPAEYNKITNCESERTGSVGFVADTGANYAIFSDNYAHEGTMSIAYRTYPYIEWAGVDWTSSGWPGGGFAAVRNTGVVFERNRVGRHYGEGIVPGRNSNNVTVRNNIIWNTRSGAIYCDACINTQIYNNIIYLDESDPEFPYYSHGVNMICPISNCAPKGIFIDQEALTDYEPTNIKIFNNFVTGYYGCYGVGWNINSDSIIEFYNNVCIEPEGDTDSRCFALFSGGSVSVKNNICQNSVGNLTNNFGVRGKFDYNLWSRKPEYLEAIGKNDPEYSSVNVIRTNWDNISISNPPVANDFRLLETSPAINTGVNLGNYFSKDFFENTRDVDGKWDIGAIEYGGAVVPPAQENCTNSVDDDSDGLIDCLDSSCSACVPPVDVVDVSDIFAKIAEWKAGQISLDDVFVVIRAWGEGGWL